MKLIRYVHHPDGIVTMEQVSTPPSRNVKPAAGLQWNRIEIYNIHGELICVVAGEEKLKLLRLKQGFYLLREVDLAGKVVRRGKLSF